MASTDLPIQTRQLALCIDSVHTELLVQRFTDRILLLITQLDKVGTLYQASAPTNSVPAVQRVRRPTAPELEGLELPPPDPSLAISRLMGSAPSEEQETLYHLYVSELASIVFGGLGTLPEGTDMDKYEPFAGRTVIIGLALKDVRKARNEQEAMRVERSTFAQVLKMALDCRVW